VIGIADGLAVELYFGNEVDAPVPVVTHPIDTFEIFLSRLHESHELSVYEAVERLLQAAAAVGFDPNALLRMLDQGMTFEELLQVIELKMERTPNAA
jgi:hypothetical protein